MKRFDYYLHKSGGYAFDYFGGIGPPYQVNILWFYFMKILGYKATRVVRGASRKRVYIRACLNMQISRRSWKMQQVLLEKFERI
jgi:hypothetical protein